MDKQKLEQQTKERRLKRLEPVVLKALELLLEADIELFSTNYVKARTIEIVEKTFNKIDFKSHEIEKVRKAFVDVVADGLLRQVHNWKDERKQLMEDVKIKDKKQKAKEALSRLDRLEGKVPEGKTEERDFKCEEICQRLARMLFDKKVLLGDEDYLDGFIELDNELILAVPAYNSVNELFETVYDALDESYKRANKNLWGKEREEITLKQIDKHLKNEK
jgi:hypothetical protein